MSAPYEGSMPDPKAENAHRKDAPIVMTVAEVAAFMRVAISTVYKYKDCDGLPFHQMVKGGAVRFYQHEILEWMTRSAQ